MIGDGAVDFIKQNTQNLSQKSVVIGYHVKLALKDGNHRGCQLKSQWAATFDPVLCLRLCLPDVLHLPVEQSTSSGS